MSDGSRHIHFGLLGLKIGDIIVFNETNDEFIVSSGDGTPGANGGTLVRNERITGDALFSIRLATRRLKKDNYDPDEDIWKLWSYKGKTLRTILEERDNHRK